MWYFQFLFIMESWTYTFTRCSHVAVMSQPREKMQRLREDGVIRGPEWLQGAVADIRRDELRAMAKAAGLPVKSNSKRLTVSELQVPLSWMHEPLSRCVLSLCVCACGVCVCTVCVCACASVSVSLFVRLCMYVFLCCLSLSVSQILCLSLSTSALNLT